MSSNPSARRRTARPQKTYNRADSERRTYGERYDNKQALKGTVSRIGVDSESLLDPVLR
jgi:hypothetical protein